MMIYAQNIYPTINPVNTKFGAPTGRSAWHEETEDPAPLVLGFKVPVGNDGYDVGAAYWGHKDVWCFTDGRNYREFAAGKTYEEAEANINSLMLPKGAVVMHSKVATVLTGYVEAMLWSERAEKEEDSDDSFSDLGYSMSSLTQNAFDKCAADCQEFLDAANAKALLTNIKTVRYDELGYYFLMCRQGHGVSFCDYPERWGGHDNAEALTELAYGFGEIYTFLNDDGEVDV